MSAADVPLAIQWHDGMLLSPQHFQEADRRNERLIAHHVRHASPYHNGIISLKLSEGTLVSGLFRIDEVEAVMPDGTFVHYVASKDTPDLSVDLRPHAAAARGAPMTVFLALPPQTSTGERSSADVPRHRSATSAKVYDEHTGEDPLDIPRITPSVHLRLSTENQAGRVCLPIAQVKLEGEAFVLQTYVPPMLGVARATSTQPSPIHDICQRVTARLRQKASRLAEKANNLSQSTDRDVILELRQQVHWLIAALPPLEAVLYSERPHPFQMFLALSAVVGQLASLAPKPEDTLLHAYNHDDLYETFTKTRDVIFKIVDSIKETFTAYPFTLNGGNYGVQFRPEFRSQQLCIGVRVRGGLRGEKAQQQQLSKWIEESIIGSAARLRTIQQERARGAKRDQIQNLGPDIVATEGVLLYKIEADSKYLDPGELLTICNTNDPQATQGPSEIILFVKPA